MGASLGISDDGEADPTSEPDAYPEYRKADIGTSWASVDGIHDDRMDAWDACVKPCFMDDEGLLAWTKAVGVDVPGSKPAATAGAGLRGTDSDEIPFHLPSDKEISFQCVNMTHWTKK